MYMLKVFIYQLYIYDTLAHKYFNIKFIKKTFKTKVEENIHFDMIRGECEKAHVLLNKETDRTI